MISILFEKCEAEKCFLSETTIDRYFPQSYKDFSKNTDPHTHTYTPTRTHTSALISTPSHLDKHSGHQRRSQFPRDRRWPSNSLLFCLWHFSLFLSFFLSLTRTCKQQDFEEKMNGYFELRLKILHIFSHI